MNKKDGWPSGQAKIMYEVCRDLILIKSGWTMCSFCCPAMSAMPSYDPCLPQIATIKGEHLSSSLFSYSDHRCPRQIRNKYFLQAPWILEQPINVENDQSWSSFPTLLKEQSVPRSHKFCGHPFWGGRLPAAPEIPRRDFSDALTPICLVVQIWKLSAWKSDYHPVWNGSKLPFKRFASQGGSKNNYKKLLSFDVLY